MAKKINKYDAIRDEALVMEGFRGSLRMTKEQAEEMVNDYGAEVGRLLQGKDAKEIKKAIDDARRIAIDVINKRIMQNPEKCVISENTINMLNMKAEFGKNMADRKEIGDDERK